MRSASSSELAGSRPEEGTLTCIVGRKGKKVVAQLQAGDDAWKGSGRQSQEERL